MFKKKTLLSLLAVSSLALSACGTTGEDLDLDKTTPPVEEQEDTGIDETTTDNTTEDTQDTTQPQSVDIFENIQVKPEEAFDIFLDKYPDARIIEMELDKVMDGFVYKIEGIGSNTEYELKIDAIDGTIIKDEMDSESDSDHNSRLEVTREHVLKVTDLINDVLADAEEGTTLREWHLEVDDGIIIFEFELDEPGFGRVEYKYNLDTVQLIEKERNHR